MKKVYGRGHMDGYGPYIFGLITAHVCAHKLLRVPKSSEVERKGVYGRNPWAYYFSRTIFKGWQLNC